MCRAVQSLASKVGVPRATLNAALRTERLEEVVALLYEYSDEAKAAGKVGQKSTQVIDTKR